MEYMKGVESVFEIIAEPNRRAILSLLVSSQQSVGEIERQLRMPQPTGSLAGSVPSVLVRSRRCSRTPPRPHGSINTNEKEDKEKKMTDREQYTPGPASGAQVRKDGEKWTLILVRELRHSPEKVWQALTDPAHLREWAPFEADGSLGTVRTMVKLTTVGAPTQQVDERQLLHLEPDEQDALAEGGYVVLVGVPDPLRARLQRRSH
jgi:DNA-binding transcriptional ArsR family regulator